MTSQEKTELIREAADDMKAERIEILDVRKKPLLQTTFSYAVAPPIDTLMLSRSESLRNLPLVS